MPSPACEVKGGAGAYQATTNGVDVTPGNTVTIHLIDTSADTWSIECAYTDETSDAATVTAALTIDSNARTATFTAPAAGKAYIFRSRVNGGVGPDGRAVSSYTTTFGVFTRINGDRVLAANQTTEGNATFGWVADYNTMVRNGGASFDTGNGSIEVFAAEKSAPTTGSVDIVTGLSLPDDAHSVIDVQASFLSQSAGGSKLFNERIQFLSKGGAFTDGTQTPLITPSTLATAPAATLTITRSGSTAKISGSGAIGGWRVDGQIVRNAVPSGVATPAPTVTSLSPNTGSTAGGTATTITGTGFVTGATVTIGGVAATGVTWVNATTITCTTGAHAAGAVDVVVTNPDAQTGTLAGGFTYAATYDPAVLTLTGWWTGDNYNAATGTLSGKASAGTSGANNLTEATNKPTAGAALNGHGTVAFARASSQKLTGAAVSTFVSASAYGGWFLIKSNGPAADDVNANLDDCLFSDAGGTLALAERTTGPGLILQHDDGVQKRATATFATAAWRLIFFRHNGTNIEVSGDAGTTWGTPVAAGALISLASALQVGCGYNASLFFDGLMADIGMLATSPSNADLANIKSYINATYGTTF